MSDGMSDGRDYGPFLSKHKPPIVSDKGKPVVLEHVCAATCKKCDGCGKCLYVVGFRQDVDAANEGYPLFFCKGCGKNNFWD